MSEANRDAQSKDPLHLRNTRGLKTHFRHEPFGALSLRQTWRPIYNQAAAKIQPSFARRTGESPVPTQSHAYRPGNTTTGSALAITGAFESPLALSMWITCPGSGGTSPMRRAITSIRSG
jgi:hypothetical protein